VIFRIELPSPVLRPFVESFWYHEGFVVDYSLERLLPDGAIELILDLTEGPKRWLDPERDPRPRSVQRSWISGQHSRHILIETTESSSMMGVRFRPGGAHPFLDVPVSELNDSVVEMECLWGARAHELRERILGARSIEERFRHLERALLERGQGRLESDPYLSHALSRIAMPGERPSIRSLARELGFSQKWLVRRFLERVGLKPKAFARVMRFQCVLQKLERESRVSWSFLAQEAGYFDQAHFIRDFETLSGLTPSRYLVERGEYLNFVPVRGAPG
jgi:methylphosphotriester-DNA--protein-cysteine methyltransferase